MPWGGVVIFHNQSQTVTYMNSVLCLQVYTVLNDLLLSMLFLIDKKSKLDIPGKTYICTKPKYFIYFLKIIVQHEIGERATLSFFEML